MSPSNQHGKADLIHVSKKRTRCHSFMALDRASDVPTADWLSQTHVKIDEW